MTKKHKSNKKSNHRATVGATSQAYNGPVIPKPMKKEQELYTVPLIFTGLISSTAGGIIDAYYSSDPNSYSLTEWTNLVALYGEYRILGMEVRYYPSNRYSKTTTLCTPLVVVVDREAPTSALGSYQSAAAHESSRILSLEDPWRESVKMQGADEALFLSTTATSAKYSVKFYADGLSVSTAYGRAFVNLLIQFRARR